MTPLQSTDLYLWKILFSIDWSIAKHVKRHTVCVKTFLFHSNYIKLMCLCVCVCVFPFLKRGSEDHKVMWQYSFWFVHNTLWCLVCEHKTYWYNYTGNIQKSHTHTQLIASISANRRNKTVRSATSVTDPVCQKRGIHVFLTSTYTLTQTHRPVTVAHRLFCVSDVGMNHIKNRDMAENTQWKAQKHQLLKHMISRTHMETVPRTPKHINLVIRKNMP